MKKTANNSIKSSKLGVSYVVSAVIMTSAVITLTLVAWSYANQTLDTQRGATEFDVAMDSMLAFNDAFENIAWKPLSSRTSRFILDYGQLQLVPNINYTIEISGFDGATYSGSTGYIQYVSQTKYKSFAENYRSNFLGTDKLISDGSGSYAKGLVSQKSGFVSMSLFYGYKAMKSSVITNNAGEKVDHIDIWIIEVKTSEESIKYTELDLTANCLDVVTHTDAGPSNEGYDTSGIDKCTINVTLGNINGDTYNDTIDIPLTTGSNKVVFNFIVSTVQIGL